jgi:hypothetical protein
MSGFWKGGRTVALGIFPAAVAYLTAACPPLFRLDGAVALGSGLLAALLAQRSTSGAGKSAAAGATVAGALAILYSQSIVEIGRLCGTDFVAQLPTILSAALAVGIGAYIQGHAKPAQAQDLPPVV